MKKSNYYLILFIIIVVAFAVFFQVYSSHSLKTKGRYTIATIDKIQPAGNGLRVYISFLYKNAKEERDYIEDVSEVKKLKINQRLFIKFDPSGFYRSFNFIDCPLPDSIKTAPDEGWSEQWMQEHFPDCVSK